MLTVLMVLIGLAVRLEAVEGSGPILRQINYLALLPVPDQPAQVHLQAQRYSPAYSDALNFTLTGPDSSTVTTGEIPPGEEFLLSMPAASNGLHVLELASGWNVCRVDVRATPAAFVARETMPLQTAREVKPLYFYVPRGSKQFSVWLVADVAREGARLQIAGPDGQTVVEEEGDYDKPQRIRVAVPAGADGKVWSLALRQPRTRGLVVDDVKLWLDPTLPPYLSSRADWALMFGKRKHP